MWLPPRIFPGFRLTSVDPMEAPCRLPELRSDTSWRPLRCCGLDQNTIWLLHLQLHHQDQTPRPDSSGPDSSGPDSDQRSSSWIFISTETWGTCRTFLSEPSRKQTAAQGLWFSSPGPSLDPRSAGSPLEPARIEPHQQLAGAAVDSRGPAPRPGPDSVRSAGIVRWSQPE